MKRELFIDWLRILAITTVFFFHASHFFDPIYWHVKNPQQSQSVLLFLGFVNIWIMPLFFFLSGAAGKSGIDKPFREFLSGKFKRLIVPLIIGILFLIPPQKYVEALSNHKFTGSYPEFLAAYFTGGIFDYKLGFSSAWIGIISYHLWFLGHLFIISVLLYPLFKLLENIKGYVSDALSRLTSIRGSALLLFVPVAVVRILMKKHFPEYTGWCDLTVYAFYFLYGFLFISVDSLRKNLSASATISLITGIILFVAYILSFRLKGTLLNELFQDNTIYGHYAFQEAAGALATWAWIIVIISAGMKFLNFDSGYRSSLNEAVMPFYCLHQTVLLLVGYVVVQWSWNPWSKFGFISLTSLFLIFIIYMSVIRQFNFTRYLFGMGRRRV